MSIDTRPLAIFLMGPTASGKTALACGLSKHFPLELVSVDSALVYRGMDIGTAKPDRATLDRHPHALVDIRDPAQPYSAADFVADAQVAMHAITARGHIPLLVGGTSLYFRALERGLSTMPGADPVLRTQLAAEAERLGWPALHARLARLDPASAARIDPHDRQRVQRALEVMALSGQPLSVLHARQRRPAMPWRALKLAVLPFDRTVLHARIARRLDVMLTQGFLDEVQALRARGDLHADLPSMRAVGYRQVWQHLDGLLDARQCRDRVLYATRQLAKRQITWLRGDQTVRLLDAESADVRGRAAAAVALFVREAPWRQGESGRADSHSLAD